MAGEKNKKSFTGLKEFYYGELNPEETGIIGTAPEHIEFLQNITIATAQEVVKAYGDDKIAELAVSTGSTTLTTTFHTLSIEDKTRLYGLKTVNGMTAVTSNVTPPYVACVFAKTAEDGGKEWIGFTKGMFTISGDSGQTKGDSVQFGSTETTGEFMSREIIGSDDEVTYLIAYDKAGETTNRDALFTAVFGQNHPDFVGGA